MTKHGKNVQKCVGKVLTQIQQKSLLKDGEGEHCIIKCLKLMERTIDEEDDDDGYDRDVVNTGIYKTSVAIKFSFKIQCIVFLNNIIMLDMTMNPYMNPLTYGTKLNCHTKSFHDFRKIQCPHQ